MGTRDKWECSLAPCWSFRRGRQWSAMSFWSEKWCFSKGSLLPWTEAHSERVKRCLQRPVGQPRTVVAPESVLGTQQTGAALLPCRLIPGAKAETYLAVNWKTCLANISQPGNTLGLKCLRAEILLCRQDRVRTGTTILCESSSTAELQETSQDFQLWRNWCFFSIPILSNLLAKKFMIMKIFFVRSAVA